MRPKQDAQQARQNGIQNRRTNETRTMQKREHRFQTGQRLHALSAIPFRRDDCGAKQSRLDISFMVDSAACLVAPDCADDFSTSLAGYMAFARVELPPPIPAAMVAAILSAEAEIAAAPAAAASYAAEAAFATADETEVAAWTAE